MRFDENGFDLRAAIRAGFVAAAVTVFAFTVAACNTMEGAGEDVESAGESIQDAAN